MINVCIPTLRRYDLLKKLIVSLERGSIKPDHYYIIDNGGGLKLNETPRTSIYKPGKNIGVSKSWNWFIKNVPESRLICNDDLIFSQNDLQKLIDNIIPMHITFPKSSGYLNIFSCFILNDDVVNKVGLFDESISPNYGYFEDNDYYRRMELLKVKFKAVLNCNINHVGSATLNSFNQDEKKDHDKRFKTAKANYIKKWGGMPKKETFSTPYGKK